MGCLSRHAPLGRDVSCSAGAPRSCAAATCTRPSTNLRADGTPFPREDCALLGVLRSGDEFAETHDTFVRRDGTLLPVAYVSSPVLVGEEIVGAVLAFWERPAS